MGGLFVFDTAEFPDEPVEGQHHRNQIRTGSRAPHNRGHMQSRLWGDSYVPTRHKSACRGSVAVRVESPDLPVRQTPSPGCALTRLNGMV